MATTAEGEPFGTLINYRYISYIPIEYMVRLHHVLLVCIFPDEYIHHGLESTLLYPVQCFPLEKGVGLSKFQDVVSTSTTSHDQLMMHSNWMGWVIAAPSLCCCEHPTNALLQ